MLFYSTNNRQLKVSLSEAVLKGLPPDNGLYMPEFIPRLDSEIISKLDKLSFQEISFEVAKSWIGHDIPIGKLEEIVFDTIQFPAPVIELKDEIYIQELFHGPSLAFKDFGARFMARLMAFFKPKENKELIILVATSGDTGGAVAAGFHNTPGVSVVILYPSGKVSKVQEIQLTSHGDNIHAIEVDGTFDDCQSLVKKAFLDNALQEKLFLSSANSINISRLIPQTFYYFEGSKNFLHNTHPSFIVPSGNFGNITAGLIAKKMGAPIAHLIASTNANKVVPDYLKTGEYWAKTSITTLANAMDVGNPSNFVRITDIFRGPNNGSTWNHIKRELQAFSVTDNEIVFQIQKVYNEQHYLLEPHTATGHLVAEKLRTKLNEPLIILGTAHPIKFKEEILRMIPTIEQKSFGITFKEKIKRNHILLEKDYSSFKAKLLSMFHVKH